MNLPIDFIFQIEDLFGGNEKEFLTALKGNSPTSIRVNPKKMGHIPSNGERVPWAENGFYLPTRPSFTFDPLFHAGCYYPQEASSMFVEQVFKQYVDGDVYVLDLCAAPGGKSTHIASLISDRSVLVSNEVIRTRANILSENITKLGNQNVVVTNNDPADWGNITSFFDVMLVDAPCSGEGMFRKDADAVDEWSLSNVRLCKNRQQQILTNVWDTLKPGGILIYSTCTYNASENEDNVQWIVETLNAEPLQLELDEEWGITGALKGNLPVYRFLPHKTKGEGFFMAVFRKTETDDDYPTFQSRSKYSQQRTFLNDVPFRQYVKNADDYEFFIHQTTGCVAIPSWLKDVYLLLSDNMKVVSCGTVIGELKGKGMIPDHSLAMSPILNDEVVEKYEVDWKTAISYLQKEALILPADAPKGYLLITFSGVPLGFVKNIGNRANNLYPQEWRIRTKNIPSEYSPVL